MSDCPTVAKAVQGKTYVLRMDFNAVSLAERISGVKLLDPDAWIDMSVTVVASVFFAAAVQTDKSLTLEDFNCIPFSDKNKTAIIDGVREAWRLVNDIPPEPERPTDGPKASPLAGEQSQS